MSSYYPDAWTPQRSGLAAAILSACENGPVPIADLRASLTGPVQSRYNRLHEMQEAGYVQVVVQLTADGRAALQRMRAKQHHPSVKGPE